MKNNLVGMVVCIILIGTSSVSTASIIGAIQAATNMVEYFSVVHSYDQSGLSDTYISGSTDFDMFVAGTTHDSQGSNDFVSTYLTGFIEYDLGRTYQIDRLAFWNYSVWDNLSAAVQSFELWADGTEYIDTFNATIPTSDPSLPCVFEFDAVTARFFRLEIISNYGHADYTAIGEVAFGEPSTPVPEPATMLLFGTGLVGLVGSRLRKKKK